MADLCPLQDPNHPNSLSHTLQNIRNGKIKALPSKITKGCVDLIHQLLEMYPNKRIKMGDIAENQWLLTNAKAYAQKIGRPDLFNPEPPTSARVNLPPTAVGVLEKAQAQAGATEDNTHAPLTPRDNKPADTKPVIDESGKEADVGCFGDKPRKVKWTTKLKRFFFGS